MSTSTPSLLNENSLLFFREQLISRLRKYQEQTESNEHPKAHFVHYHSGNKTKTPNRHTKLTERFVTSKQKHTNS